MRFISGGHSGKTISDCHTGQDSQQVWTLKVNFTGNMLHSDIKINGHFVCQVIDKIILIVTDADGCNSEAEDEVLFDTMGKKVNNMVGQVS